MDLSVVIVSWNVKTLLERCLASLQGCNQDTSLRCEIIVFDSASSDGSAEMVRQRFTAVQLVASDSNLGFTKGNNIGVAYSCGRYILLLNPDTEVVGDALQTMVAYMDRHADVGVLGPKLMFPDGRVQSSRRRFPTLATAFMESTVLQQHLPGNRIVDRYCVRDLSDNEEQDVDWVVGACLLIRREAWEQAGPLDERFFMYSEELDWCRRVKARGWRVMYVPTAVVVHHEAQSTGQVSAAREIYFHSSKVRYFAKHHGRLAGETLRFFVLASYVGQLCLEAVKWLAGHKRALRRERMAAYLRLLCSGLRTQGEVRA